MDNIEIPTLPELLAAAMEELKERFQSLRRRQDEIVRSTFQFNKELGEMEAKLKIQENSFVLPCEQEENVKAFLQNIRNIRNKMKLLDEKSDALKECVLHSQQSLARIRTIIHNLAESQQKK